MIEALLFDFGGVFTPSPFAVLRTFAVDAGLDPDVAIELCFGPYHEDGDHPWHRLERGELSLTDAREAIAALAVEAGVEFDPFRGLARMAAEDDERVEIVERVRVLRAEGYRTAVVTNNIAEFGDGWRAMVPVDELFEVVVDSSKVGDVAVVGIPDRERGERVCAVVESAAGQDPLEFAEMTAHLRAAGLMTQKLPEQLEVVERLPRNATMKILKFQLRDELAAKPWSPG